MTTVAGFQEIRTETNQDAFLVAFVELGTLTKAAQAVGISGETARLWNVNDTNGFRERLRAAQAGYADYLENLALERVKNPEGNRGSDTLLIALNNANNPDKWRGNNVTVEVSDQLLSYMQKRQQEDSKALPPSETIIEHVPKDEMPPWSEKKV